MLPNSDDGEGPVVQRCRRRIQRLQQKQPQKITGRHVFLANKMKKLALHNEGTAGVARPLSRQKVMSLHDAEWLRLSEAAKRSYELQADVQRSEQQSSVASALDEEHRYLQDAKLEEATGSQAKPSSMLISQCRMKKDDLDRLQRLFQAEFLTTAVLQKRHHESRHCPPPLHGPRFSALQQKSKLPSVESEGFGSTALRVCRGRSAFRNACFFIEDDHDTGRWYRFITAMLNPVRLVLLPLSVQELPEPANLTRTRADLDSWAATTMTHLWAFNPAEVEASDVFEDVDFDRLFVVMDSVFKAPGMLTSMGMLTMLQGILDGLDERPSSMNRSSETTGDAQQTGGTAPVTSQPAWLSHLFSTQGPSSASASTSSAGVVVDDGDMVGGESAEIGDPAVENLWDELQLAR